MTRKQFIAGLAALIPCGVVVAKAEAPNSGLTMDKIRSLRDLLEQDESNVIETDVIIPDHMVEQFKRELRDEWVAASGRFSGGEIKC